MADEASKTKTTNPFDVRTIEALVALMSQNDLSEIDLRDGAQRVRLRRGSNDKIRVLPAPLVTPTPALPAHVAVPAAVPAAPAETANKSLVEIKSPTPGTFYASANPGADPFVRLGSRVSPTTVVCLIEAMKIFNEIPAETSGVITEILVDNQQAVEYGQVLFRVDPTG